MGFIDRMAKDENEEKNMKVEDSRLPVRNMLKKGLPLNMIADLLGVDLEIVEILDKEYKEESN